MTRAFALLASTALLCACDFQTIGNQATARTVAVSTILSSPSIDIRGPALPAFDAGITIDAGVTVPAQSAVSVFFGQRPSESLEVAPVGTADASVVLNEVGGGSWVLSDLGGGNYGLAGLDAGFTYHSGATYDFTMTYAGSTYVAEVTQVPAAENIAKFHEAPGYVTLNAGDSFSFTRPDPAAGQDRALGFINVFAVSASGGTTGQPTYSNVPTTPLAFLKLVVAPQDWKQSVVTIPGSAFPDRDRNYLVVLQSAKLGGPKSSNLFSGSAILAGTADVAVVRTNP